MQNSNELAQEPQLSLEPTLDDFEGDEKVFEQAKKSIDAVVERLKMDKEEMREKMESQIMEEAPRRIETLKDYFTELSPNPQNWSDKERENFIHELEGLQKELLYVNGEEAGKMIKDLEDMKKKIVEANQ